MHVQRGLISMKQSYNIIDINLLNREIRNIHLVKPLDPNTGLTNYKPYRVMDVDVTPDYEKLKGYVEEAKKSYGMEGKIKDPFFKSDGKWWIELRDYKDYDYSDICYLKNTIFNQIGIYDPDCKIIQGNVNVRLINWEFNGKQGLSWKLWYFQFRKIKQSILQDSPEPPKITF